MYLPSRTSIFKRYPYIHIYVYIYIYPEPRVRLLTNFPHRAQRKAGRWTGGNCVGSYDRWPKEGQLGDQEARQGQVLQPAVSSRRANLTSPNSCADGAQQYGTTIQENTVPFRPRKPRRKFMFSRPY